MVGNCCPANEFLFQKRTIVPQKNCWLLSYKKYYVLHRIVVSQTNCCPTKTKCCPANKQNDVLQTINCFLTKQIAVLQYYELLPSKRIVVLQTKHCLTFSMNFVHIDLKSSCEYLCIYTVYLFQVTLCVSWCWPARILTSSLALPTFSFAW